MPDAIAIGQAKAVSNKALHNVTCLHSKDTVAKSVLWREGP